MHRPSQAWGENSGETLFFRAEKDGLFFRNLFDRSHQQFRLIKKLCQCSDPEIKLKKLKLSYEASKNNLGDFFGVIDQLIDFITLVKNKQWDDISHRLNQSDARELMMLALYSMKNVNAISDALDHSNILYALDADILTFFALKHQVIADIIVHQTLWQRFVFSIRQFFWPDKKLELPADRLKGENVSQILSQYPEYWDGPVSRGSSLRQTLQFTDLQKISEHPSKEVRQAASKAVMNDKKLREFLREVPRSKEAANARINILRDYEGRLLDKKVKSKNKSLMTSILTETPKGGFLPDDSTLENFYFHEFLSLIQSNDGKKTQNAHIVIREHIHELWSKDTECLIKKRAMIRVLRFSPENTLLKDMPENFYCEIFSDVIILKNFLENSQLTEGFSRVGFLQFSTEKIRAKMLARVLHGLRAAREGYSADDEFTIKHLLAVMKLYDVPAGEVLNHPELCVELINALLHNTDHPDVLSFIANSQTILKEKNIGLLLQHAQPMQLVEWLTRNAGVRKGLSEIIAGLDCKIKALEAENKIVHAKKGKHRGVQKKIGVNTALLQKIFKEKNQCQLSLEFFTISARIIEDKKELRDKLQVSEVCTSTVNKDEQILLNASSDPVLRQQIWENSTLQRELAEKAGLPYVLLFVHSSKCPQESLTTWQVAFEKLLDLKNARFLERDWNYLINNVPDFASWILFRLVNNESFRLDNIKVQNLLNYTVSGYDVLKLLEKEQKTDGMSRPIREKLLNSPGIISRIIRCQRKTLDKKDWANLLIRVIVAETDSVIAKHLSECCEENILHYADYEHLHKWLESGATASENHKIELIQKAYLSSERVREELDRDPELKMLSVLLSAASDLEWLSLLNVNNRGFECILKDENLLKRLKLLNNPQLNERFYLYLKKTNRSFQKDQFEQTVIDNLQSSHDAREHCQLLPWLINDVKSEPVKRKQVLAYLQSAYFSRNVHSAESESLYELFSEIQDQRAVKAIFFQHPVLGDALMAKLWLSLSEGALVNMMSREFQSFDVGIQDVPLNKKNPPVTFTQAMISTLLDCLPSEQYCQKLKTLCRNEDFLSVLLSNITLPQLNKLLTVDHEVTDAMTDYFKYNPAVFVEAMKRSEKKKDCSHLRQLQQLLSNQPKITSLFVEEARRDCEKKCTSFFDAMVIDFIEHSSDHEVVFDILNSCYSVAGGDFFLYFSVPLNDSKARIFLLYHWCGGEAMATLFNDRIDLLRQFSERICADPKFIDYLNQLEREDLAGYELRFSDLISDEYRIEVVSDGSQAFSRTEGILYTLYAFVRHVCLLYYQLMDPKDRLYNKIKIDYSLYDLFSRVVGAEDKCFKQVASTCDAKQLARLIDADQGLSNQFNPFFDWLFSSAPENRGLFKRIKQDSEAKEIFFSSHAMKALQDNNKDLFLKISAFFEEKNSAKTLSEYRDKMHRDKQSTVSLEEKEQKSPDLISVL